MINCVAANSLGVNVFFNEGLGIQVNLNALVKIIFSRIVFTKIFTYLNW